MGDFLAHQGKILYKQAPSITPEGWYPPAEWPNIDSMISDGDNGFIGLYLCYPDVVNAARISLAISASGGTIDWGDGNSTIVSATSFDTQHEFSYDDIPLTSSRGYKISLIKYYASGTVTSFSIKPHPTTFLGTQSLIEGWLALKIRTTNSNISYVAQNPSNQMMMRYLDFGSAKVQTNALFRFHQCLEKLVIGGFNSTSGSYNFSYCNLRDFDFNSLDYSTMANFNQFFLYSYHNLYSVLNISISAATDITLMFAVSNTFQHVTLRDTNQITNLSQTIYSSSIRSFEMDVCSGVTTTTSFVYTANASNNSLQRLKLNGLKVGVNLSYQNMNADALNEFFGSLGTASTTAQTITVTGCIGASTCNTSIATGKGFIVVT